MNSAEMIFQLATVSVITLLVMTAVGVQIGNRSSTARLVGLLLLLLSCYLSLPIVDYGAIHPLLSFIVARLSSAIPAVIWLLAHRFFRPAERIPGVVWFLIVGYIGLRAVGIGLFNAGLLDNSIAFYAMTVAVPQSIMLGLSVHAIYLALADFGADLVESRRRSKVVFVVLSATFIVLTRIKTWIVYNGLVEGASLESLAIPVFDYLILLFAMVFVCSFFTVAFQTTDTVSSLLNAGIDAGSQTEFARRRNRKTQSELARKVAHAMEVERAFEESGLTVNGFAEQLGVHPHKLRKVINGNFEFSNFNQFLNSYRVEEAARLLTTTTEPISAIAEIVGFSSLSAFNNAFRTKFGKTPSRYRSEREAFTDTGKSTGSENE